MKNSVHKILENLPAADTSRPYLIGIDGCGGAGKSTIAGLLALELGAQIVHVDDFYKPKEERVEVTAKTQVHINFEFDRLKQQVLEPLKHGETVHFRSARGESLEVQPRGYIIVEGLGTLGPTLREYFDFKIWLEAAEQTRRQRGIARDSEAWSEIWDTQYLPQDARYMQEERPQDSADLIIRNDVPN